MSRSRWILTAIIAAAAFGTSGTFVKPLLDAGWSPGAASLARTAGASLLLAYPTWRALRGRWSTLRAAWPGVLLFGAVGVAGTQTAYFFAVSRITVGTALMIEYLSPVLLMLVLSIVARRAPSARAIGGAALALGGLWLVLDAAVASTTDPAGIVAALAAAVACAVYFQLSATLPVPPIALAGIGMIVASVVSAVLGAVQVVPVVIGASTVRMGPTALPVLVPLGVIVVVATAFAYSAEVTAASRLGSRTTSFLGLTEVLFAIGLSALLLGQIPGPVQTAGGVLLLAGVLLVVSSKSGAPTHPRPAGRRGLALRTS